MAWRTPKTDWVATDYINLEDYVRITENLRALYDLISNFYSAPAQFVTPTTKTVLDYLYAEDLNTIENDLVNLNRSSVSIAIGAKTTYEPGGPCIDYRELNRIESATANIRRRIDNLWSKVIDSWYYCGEVFAGEV